jgi:uncharacterized membrane protein YqjE
MRRLASLLSILTILALVLLLFWDVYRHHEDGRTVVHHRGLEARVKIARPGAQMPLFPD